MSNVSLSWTTEKRKISDLVPYEHNPRTLSDKQAADLEASLRKFNLAEIPAINTDNQILAGHQRLMIMSRLGRGGEIIDVRVPSRTLTAKECQEYNIRSNKNTGAWDFDELANSFELEDLKEWGFEDKDLGMKDEPDLPDTNIDYDLGANNSVKVKVVYIDPNDWVSWRNKIINYLSDNDIKYKIEE